MRSSDNRNRVDLGINSFIITGKGVRRGHMRSGAQDAALRLEALLLASAPLLRRLPLPLRLRLPLLLRRLVGRAGHADGGQQAVVPPAAGRP